MENLNKLISTLIISFIAALLIGTIYGYYYKSERYFFKDSKNKNIYLNVNEVISKNGIYIKRKDFPYSKEIRVYSFKYVNKEKIAITTIISFCTISLLTIFFTRKRE